MRSNCCPIRHAFQSGNFIAAFIFVLIPKQWSQTPKGLSLVFVKPAFCISFYMVLYTSDLLVWNLYNFLTQMKQVSLKTCSPVIHSASFICKFHCFYCSSFHIFWWNKIKWAPPFFLLSRSTFKKKKVSYLLLVLNRNGHAPVHKSNEL